MLFCQELENPAGRRSGVVDENIDPPERGVSLLDKGLGIAGLGQISWYGDDFPVCLARNLGCCRLQRFLSTRANCDIDTFASQRECARLADTGARSRDECGLPIHPQIHEGFPRLNSDEEMRVGRESGYSGGGTARKGL